MKERIVTEIFVLSRLNIYNTKNSGKQTVELMKYNFDELVERSGTDCIKWSKKHLKEYYEDESCIPMWIADMDFKSPQPVIEAIIKRANHGIFGYGTITDEFLQSVVDWQKRRNNWIIEKDLILFTPGIIPALNYILQTFCVPGDKVVIQSPVYYPFQDIVKSNGCHVENNPLHFDGSRYMIDFEHFDSITNHPRVKVLILCNPHNPVGRVWTREELIRLGEICIKNGVLVVSDEIHSDLIYRNHKHIPFASISEEFAQNSIVCTAPTKTFNMAGLQVSNIIIKNKKLRDELGSKLFSMGINPNSFACISQVAAYTQGEEWLEQLLDYLENNIKFIENFLKTNLPKVKFIKPEGTYLGWLDFSEVIQDQYLLREIMVRKAKVALDDGFVFGKGGENFQRINFACPKKTLERVLIAIKEALK